MFFLGKMGLKRMVTEITNKKKNVWISTTLEQGAKTSQPSALHRYFVMEYDIPKGD